MKTITVNLYEFSELSEEAKNLGFEITGFDLDRGDYCSITLVDSPSEICERIVKEHSETCDTYKQAQKYLADLTKFKKTGGGNLNSLIEGFEKQLSKCYLNMLRQEYEYLTTEEAIIETIEANDWTFEANGKMNNSL